MKAEWVKINIERCADRSWRYEIVADNHVFENGFRPTRLEAVRRCGQALSYEVGDYPFGESNPEGE